MTDPLGVTMMFTTADFHGRGRNAARTGRSRLAALLVLFGLAGAPALAQAQNVLEDMTYVAQPGGRVEVTLRFAEPVNDPQAFTTETPPRIALDLAGTRNGLAQRRIDINAGATSGVSAVEAGGRTRVVVDLFRPASYETRIEGKTLVVSVASNLGGTTPEAKVLASADPTKSLGTSEVQLSNIDFRRGKAGEGRIVVNFSAPGAAADLRREGDRVLLDISNVKLAPEAAKRLDVLDFATPVQFIETRGRGRGARIEISAKPPFEQLAYQTGNEYVVEIAPKREDKPKDKNAEPVFSGSRVTFNFQDIPTRSVLQLIADVSDLNIVVADSVQGNVTLRLINVPWDQALHIVLQAKGLDQRRQGNVIWVAPQKEIADREQALADARLKMEDKVELISDYIPISYGNAKDIAALLTQESKGNQQSSSGGDTANMQRGFLSQRGTVSYDDRTNTLLVSDTPQKVQEIRALIAVLDRPVQQVLIESRIVIATDSFARELGVKFGISGGYEDRNGNVVSTAGTAIGTDRMSNLALNNRFGGGRGLPVFNPAPRPTTDVGGGIAVPSLNDRLNVNLPATTPAGSFGLAILGADYLLDLELSAAQTEGRGEVVSSPRVVTANQREAVIKQGSEVGYVTFQSSGGGAGQGTATVQFKEIVLELKVTPTITADDRVVLNLGVKKDALAGYIDNPGGGQVPQIDKREINTSVLVDNGQTVVLGGVYEVEKRDDMTKVPVLGDVPLLGNLFKKRGRTDTKAELLIFVTPRILSESLR